MILLSRGRITALGGRLFRKEVLRVGSWIHPETEKPVSFDRQALEAIAASTNAYIATVGPVPFPDGHRFDAMSNLGRWLSFGVEGDALMGVAEAGTDEIAARLGTTIRDVSVYLEAEARDSHSKRYPNAITHVAATPYPVIEMQENFVQLSRGGTAARVPVFRAAANAQEDTMYLKKIAAALGLSAEGDDAALTAAIETKVGALAADKTTAEEALAAATKQTSEATALAAKVTTLESETKALRAERDARIAAELETGIRDVKALCAKQGRPEAFAPEDEKLVRENWGSARPLAERVLALAKAAAGAETSLSGTRAVQTPSAAETARRKQDDRDTAIAMARARGERVEIDGERVYAVSASGRKHQIS